VRILAMMAVGTLYGVLLRGWMRFVSTDPEFSWSGTAVIVGAFAVLGLMVGLVEVARRKQWRRRLLAIRVVGSVLALGCFQGAGVVMFPTIVPAALALARTDWWRPLRVALIGVAIVVAVLVVVDMDDLTVSRRVVALGLYLGLCAVEAALLSRILAPSLPRGAIRAAPTSARVAVAVLPLVAVFALVIATTGIPTG
jgi:hypothetical protein